MKRIETVAEMQQQAREWCRAGHRTALVPTMGFLHEGHLSLIDVARKNAAVCTLSIFVNPTQFGPGEDLDKYPRDPERDETLCRERGVDAVFCPAAAELYAPDHSTWVVEDAISRGLCGRSRPGHFRGVTTIVAKLLNIVMPDVAVFGQKDGQQALLIRRMVRDLNVPVQILLGPTVREPDGLAMSSRNSYLTADERRRATAIFRGLCRARDRYERGEHRTAELCRVVRDRIEAAGGRVDYVELVSRTTLHPLAEVTGPAMLAVAACFGSARLIDNLFLDGNGA